MTDFKRANFSSPFGSKSSDTLLPALAAILMLVATPEQADAQALLVGSNSSDQTTNFTSGTNTYGSAVIGANANDSNNTLNVFNPGTSLIVTTNIQVGPGGNNNRMVISNGGFVSDVTGAISFGASSNNSVLVTGAGSTWSNRNQVRLGVGGQASLTVANEGSVIAITNGIQVAVSNNSVGVLNIGSFGGSDSAGSIVAPRIAFNNGTGYLNFNQTNTFTLTNAITGGNTILFQQLGSGTTILTGANSSANSTFISQGTLQIGDGGANGSIGSRAITNNSVLAINSSTNITFGSGNGIAGTGVLLQMGTGTTTLNGSNTTYSGGTLISGGTLRVGAGVSGSVFDTNGSLGTGNVTNNATLAFSRRGASDTVSNNISGTGALTMFGAIGSLTLAGSNSYSGPTTIDSSYTLQIGTGSTNGTLGTGSVSNAGTLSFNRSDLYTASNAISGAGALRQIGTGTTILLGSNSSSGTTTVTNGTLQIGNGGTSGSVGSGAISLSGAGLLAFNRADSVTMTNSIGGGGGALLQMGSGTLILTGLGASYGQTVISDGTLQIGDGGANGSIGAGAITNNSVFAIHSSTNITFGSGNGITGTGVLVQMGTGTTTLVASHTTYSGGTLINGGTLQLGNGAQYDTTGSLGTGNVTNNATLAFKRNLVGETVSNNISGTGALTMFGSAAGLTLAGSNSYSGLTTINSGNTLQIGTGSTNGTLGTGSVSNAGTLTFNRSDLYMASNTISGSGALWQIGSGTTILLGSNSSSGTTTVTNGTLQIGNGGTSGSVGSGAISLSGAGLLVFNRADSVTITNSIGGGGGALMQMGGGTLIVTGRGASYGQTVISDGTLQIGDGGANGSIGAGAITNNSVLVINSSTNVTFANSQAIRGTGVLIQMGTGTTTLVASNTTYSGGTLISGGTLQVGGGGSGSQYDTNGSLGTGNVTNNATLAFSRRIASDTASNNISGTGALTVSGNSTALTLAGSNSYSGLTTINSGNSLRIGTGSINGTLGTGSVSNAGTLSFNRSDLYTVTSAISGAGALSQIGTGTTTLSGSNTYTGTTSITAGSLIVASTGSLSSSAVSISSGATLRYNGSSSLASSITVGGGGSGRAVLGGTGTINSEVALNSLNDVLSPGNSPGIQNFTPSQTWSSFTYDWELNNFTGTTAGVDFDQISMAGALNLSGRNYTLNVISLTAGNVPGDVPNFTEVDTSWIILVAAGGISGFDDREWLVDTNSFSALGSIAGRFTISQSGNNLNLNYAVPEPSTYALLLLAGAGWLLWRRRTVAP